MIVTLTANPSLDRTASLDRPLAPADEIGLVGLEAVQRQLVFFGVDRNGLEP